MESCIFGGKYYNTQSVKRPFAPFIPGRPRTPFPLCAKELTLPLVHRHTPSV